MADVAVLIPCLDEEATIAKVVRDFREALPQAEVFVCDNASADATARVAAEAGATVVFERARGKGNAVRRLLQDVDAECFVLVDGDDTYPAESAVEMVRLVLEEGADMVVGDRLSTTYDEENTRAFHSFGNRLVRRAVKAVFGEDVADVMSGYRAFSRRFAKTLPILTGGFEIETEMTVHALDKRMRVCSVPVAYRNRPEGSSSKLRTVPDGMRVLGLIARLFRDYRPLAFFGLVSLVLAALACVFVAPVLASYLQTGTVDRLPTLVVCCFAMLAAMQSLFSGLILQSLRRKERADFELELRKLR